MRANACYFDRHNAYIHTNPKHTARIKHTCIIYMSIETNICVHIRKGIVYQNLSNVRLKYFIHKYKTVQ